MMVVGSEQTFTTTLQVNPPALGSSSRSVRNGDPVGELKTDGTALQSAYEVWGDTRDREEIRERWYRYVEMYRLLCDSGAVIPADHRYRSHIEEYFDQEPDWPAFIKRRPLEYNRRFHSSRGLRTQPWLPSALRQEIRRHSLKDATA